MTLYKIRQFQLFLYHISRDFPNNQENPEVYLEPSQASTMELLAKIVDGFQPVTKKLS